jgi:hypothetical protein
MIIQFTICFSVLLIGYWFCDTSVIGFNVLPDIILALFFYVTRFHRRISGLISVVDTLTEGLLKIGLHEAATSFMAKESRLLSVKRSVEVLLFLEFFRYWVMLKEFTENSSDPMGDFVFTGNFLFSIVFVVQRFALTPDDSNGMYNNHSLTNSMLQDDMTHLLTNTEDTLLDLARGTGEVVFEENISDTEYSDSQSTAVL